MSGGNGLLGMSLSAPVLADAVHRVRPGSVALAFDGATTPTPRRLPSTRPIDQRRDRSRGIIFSDARRPIARDRTWSRTHGIIFGKIPASTRSYAINPGFAKKKPVATEATNNATKAGSSVDNAHRGESMSITQLEGTQLRSRNTQLKLDVKSRDEKIEELKRLGSTQEDKIKQMAADIEAAKSQREEKHAAERLRLQAELKAQKKLVADLQPSQQHLERNRDEARREAEADMRRRHKLDTEQLRESYAHQIATIEQNSQAIKEARRRNQKLLAEHERDQRKHEQEVAKVQAAVKSAETEITEQKRRNRDLQSQYLGRQRRAKTDRDSYITYHHVFDDVHDAEYLTRKKLMNVAGQIEDEAWLWQNSATRFRSAKQLHLFRQTSKYNAIKKSINDFLDERARHAERGAENIVELSSRLRSQAQAFKTPAHNTRMLTRLLHYDDEQTAFRLADTAYHIAMVLPFRQRRDECDDRITLVEAEIAKTERLGQDADPALRQELVVLRDRRHALIRLLNTFETMRRLKAYEALLHDNPVEKAVFMRTIGAFEDFRQVQDKFMKQYEQMQASSDETDARNHLLKLRQEYRIDETKARRALDQLLDHARNRCVLEQELGQLTDKEQIEAEGEIKRRIARLVRQLDDSIDHLLPAMRTVGRQSRTSIVLPSESVLPWGTDEIKAKLAGSMSGAKSMKPDALTIAIKTPARQRTPEQTLLVMEAKLKRVHRAFMQAINREAPKGEAHDQPQALVEVSRRIARLQPRIYPEDAAKSLQKWLDLRSIYISRRKLLASLPNVEPGSVEELDETTTAIARKITSLKTEIKAGQTEGGVPIIDGSGNKDSGNKGSSNEGSSNGGSGSVGSGNSGSSNKGPGNGDSSNAGSGTNQGELDSKSSDNASAAELEVKVDYTPPSTPQPKGDSDTAQGAVATSGDGQNSSHRTTPGEKRPWTAKKTRRQRFLAQNHIPDSSSMESLIARLGAKSGSVSGGTSASASSGRVNPKPTSSRRSQHSLSTPGSIVARGYQRSTAFSRRALTAAASDVDLLSRLQEAELHALAEAFSTMPLEPARVARSPESMLPDEDDDSVPIARGQNATSATDSSAQANSDMMEDDGSEYSTSIASSVDSLESAELDPLPAESNDVDVELAYNIPVQDFRAAVMASSNSSAAFWSYRLYKGADGKHPAVLYCRNFELAERQAKLFANEKVLGFDLEWEPQSSIKSGNIKRNVSLIQIACEDKIALFQIALFKGETAEELMPPTLRSLLESADVVKAGVNVAGDARRMRELLKIDMKGVFELSHLYRVVKFSENEPKNVNFKLMALATQVQDILMLPLKKDDNRVGAWSRELNTQQSDYAASDAYAGFRLFHKLDEMRKSMSPMPPRPGFLEQELPLTLGNGTKVYKSTWKPSERKAAASKVADLEEEEDEFFDAIEEQDADDLTAKMESLDIAADDGAAISSVTYPALPRLDEEETVEDSAAYNSAKVAQDNAQRPRTDFSSPTTRRDPAELQAADAWVAGWKFSLPPDWTVTARPSELRAYHLWHHQGFELKEVAAICREPPLALTTVASYVMQALKEENLPYEPERVRHPRDVLPTSVHRRYQKIFDRIPK